MGNLHLRVSRLLLNIVYISIINVFSLSRECFLDSVSRSYINFVTVIYKQFEKQRWKRQGGGSILSGMKTCVQAEYMIKQQRKGVNTGGSSSDDM